LATLRHERLELVRTVHSARSGVKVAAHGRDGRSHAGEITVRAVGMSPGRLGAGQRYHGRQQYEKFGGHVGRVVAGGV
jgi:hypothetical protein